MKICLFNIIGILCCFTLSLNAQNLVLNGSLEQYSKCPQSTGQTRRSIGFKTARLSPDFFHGCANGVSSVGVPVNLMGVSAAADGNAYAGLFTYGSSPQMREFLYGTLLSNLTPGAYYQVSFKAKLAPRSPYAASHLGIRFANVHDSTLDANLGAPIYSPTPITDSGWVTISGCFQADSAYNAFVIGNHFPDSLLTVQLVDTVIPAVYTYYYIDDIQIVPMAVNLLSIPTANCLYPNDSVVIQGGTEANQWVWNGINGDSIFVAKDTGWVILERWQTCVYQKDSIRVAACEQEPCAIYFPNAFTPNNDNLNDIFNFYTSCPIESYELKVYNRWGQCVYQNNNSNYTWIDEPQGVYAFTFTAISEFKETINRSGLITLIR